jgi:hypothetical protein
MLARRLLLRRTRPPLLSKRPFLQPCRPRFLSTEPSLSPEKDDPVFNENVTRWLEAQKYSQEQPYIDLMSIILTQ